MWGNLKLTLHFSGSGFLFFTCFCLLKWLISLPQAYHTLTVFFPKMYVLLLFPPEGTLWSLLDMSNDLMFSMPYQS